MFRHIVWTALRMAWRKRKYLELAGGIDQYHFVLHYFLSGASIFRYVFASLFFLYQHLRLGTMVKASRIGQAGCIAFSKTTMVTGFRYCCLYNCFRFCCQKHSSSVAKSISHCCGISIHRYIHCRVQHCCQCFTCKTYSGKLGAVGTG